VEGVLYRSGKFVAAALLLIDIVFSELGFFFASIWTLI
jgi:hypothetical protein